METLKKNIEAFNSGHAKHPLAPSIDGVAHSINHINSGTAEHPAMHHIKHQKKLP